MIITGPLQFQKHTKFGEYLRTPAMENDSGGRAWSSLALQGITPTRLYIGGDYNLTTWTDDTGTDNLTLQAGTPSFLSYGPGPNIAGIQTDGTSYYKGSSGPTIGTQDLIAAVAMRWVYRGDDQVHIATRAVGGPIGWQFYTEGTTATPRLYIYDGTGFILVQSPALVSYEDVVLVCCVNRDENSTNGSFMFANGIAGSGVNPIGVAASITDGSPLACFALGDGVDPCISQTRIYAIGIWQGASLFSSGATGAAEMQIVADTLTQKFFGIFPQKSDTANNYPSITRATADGVVVDHHGTKRVFYVHNGGAAIDDSGLLIQDSTTNNNGYSYDISSWAVNSNVTAALTATGPDGIVNSASTLTESSDGGEAYHYITAGCAATDEAWYEIVLVIRTLTTGRDWMRLYLYDLATSTKTVLNYFDFVNRTIGISSDTTWSSTGAVVENWGNGWSCYRIFVSLSAEAAGVGLQYLLSEADGGGFYTGDGRDVCEVAHAQICQGKWRHSLVRNHGTYGTRNDLAIDLDSTHIPSGPFTVSCEFQVSDTAPSRNLPIILFENDLSHYVIARVNTSSQIEIQSNESGNGGTLTLGGDYADGNWHSLMFAIRDGRLFGKVDNVYGYIAATLPTTMDTIRIGRNLLDSCLNGRIRNIKIYDSYQEVL